MAYPPTMDQLGIPQWLSDPYLFASLQVALLFLGAFGFLLSLPRRQRGGLTASASVTRGDRSMTLLYGAYGALSGVGVALCLAVDAAKDW